MMPLDFCETYHSKEGAVTGAFLNKKLSKKMKMK